MQALTLARKRLRARIQDASTPRPVRLAHELVENGRTRFLPILSSPLARDLLANGYDAGVLDRIYENRTQGGPVARIADRVVLDLPIHLALRERYQAAVGEICAAAVLTARAGEQDVRLLAAPCGLAAELVGAAVRLRAERPETFCRLRCWGVDPDPEGTLLADAARRARETGVWAQFVREDLRRHREVEAIAAREGAFHVVSAIGLTQAYGPAETAELLRFYARLSAPGATLLLDRWQPVGRAPGLGVGMRPLPASECAEMARAAGLAIEREHPTGEGGCVLSVLRKGR